jgi:hypothetical protein
MNRALVGDVEQSRPVVAIEGFYQLDIALDSVDQSDPGLVALAVSRVHLRVPETHPHSLERPLLAPGVESDGHRCARPKCREQKIVGIRASVRAADRGWLVGDGPVPPRHDLLRASSGAAVDHDLSRLGRRVPS